MVLLDWRVIFLRNGYAYITLGMINPMIDHMIDLLRILEYD